MNEHVQIGLGIAAVITLIGVGISFFRKSAVLRGYQDYQADINRIVSALRAELFRDGGDLVITGNYKQSPIQIRFSYAENTPGLNVRMQAPVSFTFSVVPKGERATEGRVLVRTGDDLFDARFAARTDHPTQAKMLVGSKSMRTHMEKLCCSSKTFLTMTKGSMELSELVIPSPSTARHVLDHVESMGVLAKMVESIPGAESVKIKPYEREKSAPVFRIALAVGAICTLLAVFILKPTAAQPTFGDLGSNPNYAPGVNSVDAMLIRDIKPWRAATTEDFDPAVRGTLRGAEGLSGRIPIDLDGDDKDDVVYWLLDADNRSRVVFLRNGNNIYDTLYTNLAGVGRVPQGSIAGIEWKQRPTAQPEGDALLLVMRSDNGYSGLVVFPHGERLYFGAPQRFENVSVR
jgi:hypothetical protein